MSCTVVVTRNVPERFRGFLSSCMLEIAPGVYLAPSMNRGVRDRVRSVLAEWSGLLSADGGILLTYPEASAPAGQAIHCIGFPKADLVQYDGIWLSRRKGEPEEAETLGETETPPVDPE